MSRLSEKEYRKKWLAAHPNYHRKWAAAHPGRRTEITKKWRIDNAERYRISYEDYNRKNAQKHKETTAKWRDDHRKAYNKYMREYMKEYLKGMRRKDGKKTNEADGKRDSIGA